MPSEIARWVFPTPGSADEQNVLGSGEKLKCGQFPDELLVDLRLEGEVKLFETLEPAGTSQAGSSG